MIIVPKEQKLEIEAFVLNKDIGFVSEGQKSEIKIDASPHSLSPGMTVAVEMKTGKRKLIEYFLSPLLKYRSESVRER